MTTAVAKYSVPMLVPTHVLDFMRGFVVIAYIYFIALILEQGFGIMGIHTQSYWAWVLILPTLLLGAWGMYFLGAKQCKDWLKRMSTAHPMAPL